VEGDLLALSLWAGSRASQRLSRAGKRISVALWRDIARWYHAGLGNLCGPYTRTYGMDPRWRLPGLALQVVGEVTQTPSGGIGTIRSVPFDAASGLALRVASSSS
jgi:hypothetical protein